MNVLTQFASSEAAQSDIFTALGIDWKMLVFQLVGFLLLVWLVGKFVFPPLFRAVDTRREQIEAGAKAAEEAKQQASAAHEDVEKMLKQARAEASDIVATAKEEATAAVEKAEAKSKARAEHIVSEARAQIDKEVTAAKKALHNETVDLVAQATEKVLGKTVDAKVDEAVVSAAVKEAK